MEVIKKLAV